MRFARNKNIQRSQLRTRKREHARKIFSIQYKRMQSIGLIKKLPSLFAFYFPRDKIEISAHEHAPHKRRDMMRLSYAT